MPEKDFVTFDFGPLLLRALHCVHREVRGHVDREVAACSGERANVSHSSRAKLFLSGCFFFLGVIIFALNHPLEILLVRRLEMGSTLTCFCQIVVEFLLNNSLHLKDHCSDNHLFIGAVTPYLAFSSLK